MTAPYRSNAIHRTKRYPPNLPPKEYLFPRGILRSRSVAELILLSAALLRPVPSVPSVIIWEFGLGIVAFALRDEDDDNDDHR